MEFADIPKKNYFYSEIACVAFSYHGHLELFTRSFILNLKALCENQEQYEYAIEKATELMQLSPYVSKSLKEVKTLTPIILAPEFKCINNTKTIYFDANNVSSKLLEEGLEKIYENLISTAQMALSAGFERVMQLNLADSDVLQFFRHIRNASSHNGKFLFYRKVLDNDGNLLKSAKWKNFTITSDLKDKPLFSKKQFDKNKFWDIGDMIDFLLDFENSYTEIKHLP